MGSNAGRKRFVISGAILIVVIGIVVLLLVRNGSSSSPAPSVTASYPTTPPPNTPHTTTSASPTPPTATDLDSYVPESFAGYTWEATAEDPVAIEAGAIDATTGAFQSSDETILSSFAEWNTAEEAAAFAQQRGIDENPGQTPLVDDSISAGAGHYWYYVVDDDTGLIYWYFGRFSGRMTGDAYSVQEFFLGFPR